MCLLWRWWWPQVMDKVLSPYLRGGGARSMNFQVGPAQDWRKGSLGIASTTGRWTSPEAWCRSKSQSQV